jgi:glycosyltransferase involved in cell wall biosynthesis
MARQVAHVVTRCIAGAGGVVVRGAVSLDPARYHSVIVTGTAEGPLLDEARRHGIDVVHVPELISPISLRADARALLRLVRVLRERHVEIVHTHSAKAGALGRVAARRAGAGLVVHTLHGFPFHDFQGRLSHLAYVEIERRLSKITDAYLAVGTGVAVEAIRRGLARPEQIHTIGPAVDPPTVPLTPETRARARSLLGLPPLAKVVGTVGRLDFQKAPEVLLDAIARLHNDRAVLVWAGHGELAEFAAQTIERLGLDDRARLLGNRQDVPRILPAFDVFAMASRYEGLPCVIVEAQQCGIPVVATAVNAVPDVVIPGETGLLVPPERPDLLASAIDYALDHPGEASRWAASARALLGSRYDPATLGEVLDQVYSRGRSGASVRSASPPELSPSIALTRLWS